MPTLFPPKGRLYHRIPPWVPDGEVFHVRVRCRWEQPQPLTDPELASHLLNSVRHYHDCGRWYCVLFLLMPDHWHGLLAFPVAPGMSATIRAWKAFHTRLHGICWQDGYFDHRIRGGEQLTLKGDYIRRNPEVKGLCARPDDWRWKIDLAGMGRD